MNEDTIQPILFSLRSGASSYVMMNGEKKKPRIRARFLWSFSLVPHLLGLLVSISSAPLAEALESMARVITASKQCYKEWNPSAPVC